MGIKKTLAYDLLATDTASNCYWEARLYGAGWKLGGHDTQENVPFKRNMAKSTENKREKRTHSMPFRKRKRRQEVGREEKNITVGGQGLSKAKK